MLQKEQWKIIQINVEEKEKIVLIVMIVIM